MIAVAFAPGFSLSSAAGSPHETQQAPPASSPRPRGSDTRQTATAAPSAHSSRSRRRSGDFVAGAAIGVTYNLATIYPVNHIPDMEQTLIPKLRRVFPSALPLAERQSPLRINARAGQTVFLYAAYCRGFAKIGLSQDPKRRIAGMQSGCPFLIELLEAHPLAKADAEQAEFVAAKYLQQSHAHGEWFKCSKPTARFAVLHAARQFERVIPTGGPRRPDLRSNMLKAVATPDGVFRSMKEAAAHYGVTNACISLRVARKVPGWRRATADERAQLP